MKVSRKLGFIIGVLIAGLFSITGFAKDKVEGAKASKANPSTMSNADMDSVVGAGSSGGTLNSEMTLKPSELSSSCQPQPRRSLRIQTRAFKCRQAIRKRHERFRSKSGGEAPRR